MESKQRCCILALPSMQDQQPPMMYTMAAEGTAHTPHTLLSLNNVAIANVKPTISPVELCSRAHGVYL